MPVFASRPVEHKTNNDFLEFAKEAIKLVERIPRQYGESGGGHWQPYQGGLDIDGLRISVQGNKQCQFGSNDLGLLTIKVVDTQQKGAATVETTEEVLKFEYELSNGWQYMVSDPAPMELVPKVDDKGNIKGQFSPGLWQRKILKLTEQL